jgi:tryptophanyl-tRNA synthetase
MTADQTAALIKRAVTDSDRHITYDPIRRPEVSNLVLLAALCLDRTPDDIAEQIGDAGAGALKRLVTDALNQTLAPVRARRTELLAAPDHLRAVLHEGNQRANARADATLAQVRRAMRMDY